MRRSDTSPVLSGSKRDYSNHRNLFWLVIFLVLFNGMPSPTFGQNSDSVVAVLNGRAISLKELDDSVSARVLPLQQQLYAVRKVALENLINKQLLESEARKRKISVEELRKTFMEGPVNISREEVEAAYKQNASYFATISADEAKERLRLDLEGRARLKYFRASLDKLRQSSAITLNLSAPSLDLDDGSPAIGSKASAVTIVEFLDFECPYCRSVQPILKQVLEKYGSNIRFIFKNLPLDGHQNSTLAAKAAYCAGEQDRFWQYHDRLLTAKEITAPSIKKLATDLGLNLERFQNCIGSNNSSDVIIKDLESARRLGIESTPSFVINGNVVVGAISFDTFQQLIEGELQRSSQKASSSN